MRSNASGVPSRLRQRESVIRSGRPFSPATSSVTERLRWSPPLNFSACVSHRTRTPEPHPHRPCSPSWHSWQCVLRFEGISRPPIAVGTTWCAWRFTRLPQRTHRPPSRRRTNARSVRYLLVLPRRTARATSPPRHARSPPPARPQGPDASPSHHRPAAAPPPHPLGCVWRVPSSPS